MNKNKKLIRIMLTLAGIIFFAMGVISFFYSHYIMNFFSFDKTTAQIISGMLVFTGLTDILVAKIKFADKDPE